MQAVQLLHKIVKKSCVSIHSNRLNALFMAVSGLAMGGKLTLAGLGRSLVTGSKVKNNIKRIDRLLGNSKLHNEKRSIYHAVTQLIIRNTKTPLIIIDWSSLPHKNFCLLRAAVAMIGRSTTIYEEVHPLKKLNNAKVHKNFLKSLSKILPYDCKPIVITDAGYHSPFFREVEKLNWDWIGRIRCMTKYKINKDWTPCNSLHEKATKIPTFIADVTLSRQTPIRCSIFLFKGKSKGRIDKNKFGKRIQRSKSRTIAKANKEPWVLATSLKGGDKIAKKIVCFYKRRMQIEEGFRDLKNSRLGFGLTESKTYILKRFEILLLIAMLAMLAVTVLGAVGTQRGIQYGYQANSIRNRTVLSLFFLGCQMIKQGDLNFKIQDFLSSLTFIRKSMLENASEEL